MIICKSFLIHTLFEVIKVCSDRNSEANVLKWEPAATINISQLLPSGRENNSTSFVARAHVNGIWMSGKFCVKNKQHIIHIPFLDDQPKEFEVLVTPPGTVSWVGTESFNVPNYWIAGGSDPISTEDTFICRAWHGEDLIIGSGKKSMGSCFVGAENKVYTYSTYEILTLDEYGIAIGAADITSRAGPLRIKNKH